MPVSSDSHKPFKKSYRFSNETMGILSRLKERTHLSETEIIEQALLNFQRHQIDHPLLAYAGTMSSRDAETMMQAIYQDRHNKDEPGL